MKKTLLFLVTLLAMGGSLFAQQNPNIVRFDGFIQPAGGGQAASVAVCSAGGSGGPPCSPLATIYSDQSGTAVQSNPFTADPITGRYTFFAVGSASGTVYAVQTYGTGYSTTIGNVTLTSTSGGGGGGISSGGGLDQTINPMQAPYNAVGGVKGLPNCSWTNATQTVTCSDAPFVAGDVGKIMFGTRSCAQINVNCLTNALDFAQGTITGFTSSSIVTVSTTAGATCPDGTHPNCNFYWGTADDTAAIIAAQNAAWNTPGVCRALQLPATWFFMTLSATATNNLANGPVGNACATATGTAAFSDLSSVGPEIYGQGQQVSKIILLPGSVFTGCTNGSGSTSCMGTAPNLQAHDFSIDGGQNPVGGTNASILWESVGANGGGGCDGGSSVFNMAFSGFALTTATSIGFQFGSHACNDPYYANINVMGFGALPCQANFSDGFGGNTLNVSTLLCFGGNKFAFNVTGGSNYQLNTWGSAFYSSLTTGFAVVTISAALDWNSNGDNFLNANVTGTQFAMVRCNAAANVSFRNDRLILPTSTAATTVLFYNPTSGCTYHISNTKAIATGTNNQLFLTSAGSNVINEGGNSFTNGTVANTFTGNAWATPTESGTINCATSAATIVFKGTYLNNPLVVIQDQTTAGVVTQTSINTTQKVVGCPGATDTLLYTVTPNPI